MKSKELIFDTTLEINMKNLISNLNYFKSLLKPETKIMAMVKAFSYGLGAYEIAKLLEVNRVDYLGVANIYEGIELRKANISLPIMVMKPELESFDLVIKYQLTPTIFSITSLAKLITELEVNNYTSSNPFLISVKIDTGMHRLGFDMEEIPKLLVLLEQSPFIKIESVFSHLAASDEEDHDAFTLKQINEFTKITTLFSERFDYHIDRHILNSNGIIRFNDSQMDMVRLGIGLYGVSSDLMTQKNLLSATTLKSKIAQIKRVKGGDTVGYNRKGETLSDITIATIPVGYADGLSRALGNGNWSMLVNSKKTPIVGNVCMDMVMINVTEIDCKEGDEVLVFSDKNTITQMASCIGTIPYEILTSYSPRVRRVFRYD